MLLFDYVGLQGTKISVTKLIYSIQRQKCFSFGRNSFGGLKTLPKTLLTSSASILEYKQTVGRTALHREQMSSNMQNLLG